MPKIIDDKAVYRAALQTFITHGYRHATMKLIAANGNIHEATLFRRYGNKAKLITQAINVLLSDSLMNNLVYTGNLRADLIAIINAYMETSREYGEVVPLVLLQIPRHSELQSALASILANTGNLAMILQRYQSQGLLRSELPQLMANALLGPIMSHQMFRRALGRPAEMNVNAEEYVDMFLRGRATTPHG